MKITEGAKQMIYEEPYMTIIVFETDQSDIITASYTPGGSLDDLEPGTGEGEENW